MPDPLWDRAMTRNLISRQDAGSLLRLARRARGLRQVDLARRIGCSASTISRLETRSRTADLELLRQAAAAVGIPSGVLGAVLGLDGGPATKVAPDREEDRMRRRTLLAAAGLAGPAGLLTAMDDALALTPGPAGVPHAPVAPRLVAARRQFDAGAHTRLLSTLPGLLGDAHAETRTGDPMAHARLSSCYTLATATLSKIGSYERARLTADRARVYADLSGSPLVGAAAARELSIVLRHQDQPAAAQRLVDGALRHVEATGLRSGAQTSAYAQMLCTCAYTAARGGDRHQALTMIREATAAARSLPDQAPAGRLFPITPAEVSLYAVGVHWALGDAGAALETGQHLHSGQFTTAERRGRLHTDLGRAWWQWGRPEETARELLAAARVSPGEVRDRPAIRQVVADLTSRHPLAPGVRELAAATGVRG